jgi:hypothetical protein
VDQSQLVLLHSADVLQNFSRHWKLMAMWYVVGVHTDGSEETA